MNKLKCIVMIAVSIENFKKLKYIYILKKKQQVFLLLTLNVVANMKISLKKKNQLKCWKFLI